MQYFIFYLMLINALTLFLMHADKEKARHKRRRIPEKILLGCALLGGSLGGYWGMRLFRHKTRHLQFSLGLPVLLAVQTAILILFFSK